MIRKDGAQRRNQVVKPHCSHYRGLQPYRGWIRVIIGVGSESLSGLPIQITLPMVVDGRHQSRQISAHQFGYRFGGWSGFNPVDYSLCHKIVNTIASNSVTM